MFVSCGLFFDMDSKLANVCLNVQRDVEALIRSIAALSQRSQVAVSARESDSIEIFTDRHSEFSARREQVSNLAHSKSLAICQFALKLAPHHRFNVLM